MQPETEVMHMNGQDRPPGGDDDGRKATLLDEVPPLFCRKCQTLLESGASFCHRCGQKQSEDAPDHVVRVHLEVTAQPASTWPALPPSQAPSPPRAAQAPPVERRKRTILEVLSSPFEEPPPDESRDDRWDRVFAKSAMISFGVLVVAAIVVIICKVIAFLLLL